MKARFLGQISIGLAFSALPFVAGCTQQSAADPETVATATTSAPVIAAAEPADASPAPPVETDAPAPAGVAAVATPAPGTEKKLPPTVRPNSAVAEVVKLAQAGVEESVMYTYITNSSSTFNLSS